MIFKHNKNISRNFIAYLICIFFIISCGGGGDSSVTEPNKALTFSVSGLPATVESYDEVAIQIVPSIEGCIFQINSDFLWLVSSDGLSFTFKAPIIFTESKEFTFQIAPTNTTVQRECDASKNLILNVTRNQTKYMPDPDPSNIPYLASQYFTVNDIGMGGIEITDRYSATVCYPTENDCVTYNNELFGQDAHNIATGDFNGDGYEDLVVSWAVFPHTLEREITKSTLEIYLNDQKGRLIKDHDFFFDGLPPERMMNYRVLIDDFNQDGVDDIFSGTSGLSKRNPDGTWYFKGDSHVLLMSDAGKMVDASSIIDGNDGLSAHDASSGDVNGDGYPDIFSGRKLFINNKGISFTDDTEKLPTAWKQNYQKYQYPMSSLLEDFNGDGLAEIVIFWNDDEENIDPPFPEILMSDANQSIEYWEMQTLTEGYFGSGRTKFNYAAAEDIDSDGDKDIVIGTTRSTPYYMGRFIQIFINDGLGYFTDESFSKMGEQPRSLNSDDPSVTVECTTHGEGALFLRDYEGDGDLDIFDQTAAFSPSDCPGMNIYINDGMGNFKKDTTTQFAWVTGNQISGFDFDYDGSPINRAIPLDLDKKNKLDFASQVYAPSYENIRYLYQIMSNSD